MSESTGAPPADKPRRKRQRRPDAGGASSSRRGGARAARGSSPRRRGASGDGGKAAKPRRRRTAGEAKRGRPPLPTGWRNPRTRLGGSGIVLIGGLVLVSLGPSELGAGLTLLGALAFFYSIHRYGRLGPDQGGETL